MSALVVMTGLAFVVVRRLASMRQHLEGNTGDREMSREHVVAAGVRMLMFELAVLLWIVTGWSSLVALRTR